MPRLWNLSLAALLASGQFASTVVAQYASLSFATIAVTSLASPITTDFSSMTTATPTSSREPQVHTIKAGAGGFSFTPQETEVPPGDIVTFEFVFTFSAQSGLMLTRPPGFIRQTTRYGRPSTEVHVCRTAMRTRSMRARASGSRRSGSKHLQKYVAADEECQRGSGADGEQATHFNITINDTQPIFFYCGAPGSCIDKLMVGAINPNSTQTLQGQIQAANHADFQLVLGEAVPNEATSTLRNGPTGAPSNENSSGGGGGMHLSSGAIAGIVVGAVAFLVICAALFFFVGRSKSLKEVIKRQDASARASGSHMGAASPGYAEAGHLPQYAQHNATETHPSGWASPDPQHMSMMSQTSGMSQEQ
jgi:hypothetical protein